MPHVSIFQFEKKLDITLDHWTEKISYDERNFFSYRSYTQFQSILVAQAANCKERIIIPCFGRQAPLMFVNKAVRLTSKDPPL